MTPSDQRILPAEFGHWLAGLCDGEACFYIGKAGCAFLIQMRADDGPVLEEIRDTLGFGRIHYVTPTLTSRVKHPTYRYEVSRKQHLLKITRIFDQFPLHSKKARDFAVWREAVIEHNRTGKLASMQHYRRDMSAARKYEAPGHERPTPRPLNVQQSLLEGAR